MKTIYKYPIPMKSEFHINLPERSEVLKFGLQDDKPMIWVLIHNGSVDDTRRAEFRLAGTGHMINDNDAEYYHGTVFMNNGLVFHLFSDHKQRNR